MTKSEPQQCQKTCESRWHDDPGAIPGEPYAYLDPPDGDIDKAKAVIVEHDRASAHLKYEACLPGGWTIGRFASGPEARRAAEKYVDKASGQLTE